MNIHRINVRDPITCFFLASALLFTPYTSFSQSLNSSKESEESVLPLKEKNDFVESPENITSFYGDVALNPFKQPNYKTHGAFTLNYYGSGDINNDNKLNWTDYNSILGSTSDRADIDGNGSPGQTADKNLLFQYLTDQIPYLPAHFDLLQTRNERLSWVQKALAIDQTQIPKAGWNCYDYSKQLFINLCGIENIAGSGLNFSKYDTTKNGRFNISFYESATQTSSGVAHSINAVMVGDSIVTFNNGWKHIEPQNDQFVLPGNTSMGANSFVNISRFSYFWNSAFNQYQYGFINLVNFDLQGGQVVSTTVMHPDAVLYRTLANVHLSGTKPANAIVNWVNGVADTSATATGFPTGISPAGTITERSDSIVGWNSNITSPNHWNYDIKRNWKLKDPNNSLVDTTLASTWTVYGRPAQNIHVQDVQAPTPLTTPNGLTLYYTQQGNIPATTASDIQDIGF